MNKKLKRIAHRRQWIKNAAAQKERHRRGKSSANKNTDTCFRHPNTRFKLPIPRSFRRNYTDKYSLNNNVRVPNSKKNKYQYQYLPINLQYILYCKDSPFYIGSIKQSRYNTNGNIEIPTHFSILETPKESYDTLRRIISALIIEDNELVTLNYSKCKEVSLSTQIILDIILMDYVKYRKKCLKTFGRASKGYPNIRAIEINDESLQKMIFSVGSPVNLGIGAMTFDDIIQYRLNVHDNDSIHDSLSRMVQKEIDTTEMIDYVNECLQRMNKRLTPEKLDDLCTVVGEILINAEEHSSTKYRFSMGYFKEENDNGSHYGLFKLVILNFGQTIYEKFKSPNCPNVGIVQKMKALSSQYTKKRFFKPGKLDEESLWTLYALQEGVTSVSTNSYKRGNGSIRFLESFFNIKGSTSADNVSLMTIASGRARIVFNGEYSIIDKANGIGETFKMMTFNSTGNIEDKPDEKYVTHSNFYFPGTLITANILLNDDDIKLINYA